MSDGVQQRFRIGMAAPVRSSAGCLKLISNIEMIVDLTVERYGETAAVAAHRLRAGLGEIEDRQTAVSKGDAGRSVGPDVAGVGAAMPERIRHPLRVAGERGLIAATRAKQADDPA